MSSHVRAHTSSFISSSSRTPAQRVTDTYKNFLREIQEPPRTGLLARIVTSTLFEIVTFLVIAAYGAFAMWMTNALMGQPEILELPSVVWTEMLFLSFFLVELVLRLSVHRLYFFCNADMGWNWLDFLIIIFSVVDVSLNSFTTNGPSNFQDVSYARVVRALRISKSLRMLRAVRFVNELRVLVNCIVTSFSVLLPCVVLLLLILAGVSTALVQLVASYVQEHRIEEGNEFTEQLEDSFGSVQASMMSLFMSTTGGQDWGKYYKLMNEAGPIARLVYVLYLLFFFVAAWNIITSLFIEKALALSQPGVEAQMLHKHREDMHHAAEIVKILEEIDGSNTGTISLSKFKKYMQVPRFRFFFECRDLDIKDAEMFFRILSSVSSSTTDVNYDTFAYGCMRMKGYASSLDMQCVRVELKTMYLNQGSLFNYLVQELGCIRGALKEQQRPGFVGGSVADHPGNAWEDFEAPNPPGTTNTDFGRELLSTSI